MRSAFNAAYKSIFQIRSDLMNVPYRASLSSGEGLSRVNSLFNPPLYIYIFFFSFIYTRGQEVYRAMRCASLSNRKVKALPVAMLAIKSPPAERRRCDSADEYPAEEAWNPKESSLAAPFTRGLLRASSNGP